MLADLGAKAGEAQQDAYDSAHATHAITSFGIQALHAVSSVKRVSDPALIRDLRAARLLGPATRKWTEAPTSTKRRRASKEQTTSVCDSDFFPVEITTPQLLVALSSGIATLAPQSLSNASTKHELLSLRAVACQTDDLTSKPQTEFFFASPHDRMVYQSIISSLDMLDTLRFQVFVFLWERGLTVLGGGTYGADFLSYSGDPNIVHSSAVILVLPWVHMTTDQQHKSNMAATDAFSAQQLTSLASVAKIARKQALVASVDPDTDMVVMLDVSLIVSSNTTGSASASITRLLK